jgi:predicted membrane-bound spermidine synthase
MMVMVSLRLNTVLNLSRKYESMEPHDIIKLLIAIIGTLIGVVCGLYMRSISDKFNEIKNDIAEVKDMFIRHVRNSKIHVNMNHLPDKKGADI